MEIVQRLLDQLLPPPTPTRALPSTSGTAPYAPPPRTARPEGYRAGSAATGPPPRPSPMTFGEDENQMDMMDLAPGEKATGVITGKGNPQVRDVHRRPVRRRRPRQCVLTISTASHGERATSQAPVGAVFRSGPCSKVESMLPCEGEEEILSLTANRFSPPALIIHAPDACAYRAAFGSDTGQGSALDAALSAAGAVFPSRPEASEAEVIAYFEEYGERLPELVFTAVGAYTDVTIDQDAVKAGDLPSVLIAPA